MNPPAIIKLPLSTFENMAMEFAWRIDDIRDQFKEFYMEMYYFEVLFAKFDYSTSSYVFNPLQTIGKYC